MKIRLIKKISSLLIAVVLFAGVIPFNAQAQSDGEKTALSIRDKIIEYNLENAGASSVQNWINGNLSDNAGISSEWYAIALSQYKKYDFSTYKKALSKYLSENSAGSAVSRLKFALALTAVGSNDLYIEKTLNDSIGKQGIMSYIFGLHLLNNGYRSDDYSISDLKKKLISFQLSDGGFAVMGKNGDVDVTAMALQALAPYSKSDKTVSSAVDKALNFLQNAQKSTGDFASYGINNAESSAQVLIALSSLGIDAKNDSRFIKNGHSLFDAIDDFRLANGSFSHKLGGNSNATATVQVLCSMIAYIRMANGENAFYILDGKYSPANDLGEKATVKQNNAVNNADRTAQKSSNGNIQKSDNKSKQKGFNSKNSAQGEKIKNSKNSAEKSKAGSSAEKNKKGNNSSKKADNGKKVVDGDTQSVQADSQQPTNAKQSEKNKSADKSNGGYKLWASLAVLLISLIICAVLFAKNKRNAKNFIVIFVLALLGIAFIMLTNFQSKDEYYSLEKQPKNAVGEVTLSIRCDTVTDKSTDNIPKNGVVLDTENFQIEKGDTVYDVLKTATKKNKIHLETSGTDGSVYVEGIANIYEFDFGDLSGWVYFVNGKRPSVSCDEYTLNKNDKIEWRYTCNLGEDFE